MSAEQMTPRERVEKAASFQEADRVPVVLHTMAWATKYTGTKLSECLIDPGKFVDAQVKAQEEFGYDSVTSLGAINEISEAFGSRLQIYDYNVPTVAEYAVKSPEDLDRLEPIADISSAGRIPVLLEIVRGLKRRVGNRIPVLAVIRAPFTTASTLRGIGNLYLDLIENPDFAHRLIDFCVEPSTAFATAVAEAGADLIWVGNSAATSPGLSPKHYREFSVPYSMRMLSRLKRSGTKSIALVDDPYKIDMAVGEGFDVLQFVAEADLEAVKRAHGREVVLMGCVENLKAMLRGTPEQVEAQARRCIEVAGTGGGFFLSADNPLPRDTPPPNVYALVGAAKT